MDKVFFRIIVPNYNNLPYIKKCLDSILNQTFQDFKIIVVDDLSVDFSDKICEMYARKHPNKIIFHQLEKKGYAGGARNWALDYNNLQSEYTLFADSDDYFYDDTAFERLKNHIDKKRSDIYLLSWCHEKHGKFIYRKFEKFDSYKDRLLMCPWNATWAKCIKSELVEKCLTDCMYAEDTYAWLLEYDKTDSITQIDDIIYVYRNVSTSAVHTKNGIHVNTKYVFEQGLKQAFGKLIKDSSKRAVIARINDMNDSKRTVLIFSNACSSEDEQYAESLSKMHIPDNSILVFLNTAKPYFLNKTNFDQHEKILLTRGLYDLSSQKFKKYLGYSDTKEFFSNIYFCDIENFKKSIRIDQTDIDYFSIMKGYPKDKTPTTGFFSYYLCKFLFPNFKIKLVNFYGKQQDLNYKGSYASCHDWDYEKMILNTMTNERIYV